jgi:hypothetical protein
MHTAMMFQEESMVIPSLYTREDQAVIERWLEKPSLHIEKSENNDANKVAEIALFSVQKHLPQGLSIKEDGSSVIGRKTWGCAVPMRNNVLNPIHLFDINQDDSHSGLSCPEAYYATYLPGYNLYAVTISHESAYFYGFFDLAIGCFHVDNDEHITAEAGRIITAWWQFRLHELSNYRWDNLLTTGLFDAAAAFRLREEVWNMAGTPKGTAN